MQRSTLVALAWAAVAVGAGIAMVAIDPWLGLLMLVLGVFGRWLLIDGTGWGVRYPLIRYVAAVGIATVAASSIRSSAELDSVTGAWLASLLFFLAFTRSPNPSSVHGADRP